MTKWPWGWPPSLPLLISYYANRLCRFVATKWREGAYPNGFVERFPPRDHRFASGRLVVVNVSSVIMASPNPSFHRINNPLVIEQLLGKGTRWTNSCECVWNRGITTTCKPYDAEVGCSFIPMTLKFVIWSLFPNGLRKHRRKKLGNCVSTLFQWNDAGPILINDDDYYDTLHRRFHDSGL